MFYPKEYNGCFAACPDPIDFRAYTVVNIYEDRNAYHVEGPWRKVKRPGMRDYLGHISTTLEDMNRRELVLGTKSRSGQQWDIWEAVYSPVGPDGYPEADLGQADRRHRPRASPPTGARTTTSRTSSAATGPRSARTSKARSTSTSARRTTTTSTTPSTSSRTSSTRPEDPFYGGEVAYGCRDEHCWNGDPTRPNALSRLRYHQMYAPKIVERLLKTAPPGGDVTSWRY